MRRIDIAWLKSWHTKDLPARIDRIANELGFVIASRTTLATIPGSIHWHIRKTGFSGTLEITIEPTTNQVWFGIHSNREASWIDDAIHELSQRIVAVD